MSKCSGFVARQKAENKDMSVKIQLTTRQFMVDTAQLTLHKIFGFGYDRIMKFTEEWEKVIDECEPVLIPKDPLCGYTMVSMDKGFEEICKDKSKCIPSRIRYKYIDYKEEV